MTTGREQRSVRATLAFSGLALSLAFTCGPQPAVAKDGGTAAVPPSSQAATLKSVKDVAHRLRKAALDVINDIEQRDMVVTGEPMLIQPQAMKDDDKPIGWAQQMEDLGPALPPKKKWLDMDVANVGDLVNLLSADVAAVDVAPAAQGSSPWTDLKSIVTDIQNHYANLKKLTKGPKYDNIAIGKEALKIFDDVKRLETPWKAALEASRQGG